MQATGQMGKITPVAPNQETTLNPSTPATLPADRGNNPARKAKTRDTTSTQLTGNKNATPAMTTPPAGKKSAKQAPLATSEPVTNPDSASTPIKTRKPRTPKAGA
jgi:hypothetical protein